MRTIIDLPRVFVRATSIGWRVDWRGQSAGADAGGGDQTVMVGFARWRGELPLILPPPMVAPYRAILTSLQGRVRALRVPMVDPLVVSTVSGSWQELWAAYQAGQFTELRPKVEVTAAAAAGATSLVVDERPLLRPVAVGAILSYLDWPFMVVGRSGSGATVTLTVERLAVAVPEGGLVDLEARGVFTLDDPGAGLAPYGVSRVGTPVLPLTEWITR